MPLASVSRASSRQVLIIHLREYNMSILGVFIRFFFTYIALMLAIATAFYFLGITSNSGINVAILMGAVLWPCMAFGKKNGRYFNSAEKTKVVWGMIGINLAIQLLFSASAFNTGARLHTGLLLGVLAFVGVIHSLVIYYFVGQAGKWLEKQQAKKAAASS